MTWFSGNVQGSVNPLAFGSFCCDSHWNHCVTKRAAVSKRVKRRQIFITCIDDAEFFIGQLTDYKLHAMLML